MDVLKAALKDALAGQGQLVMLVGESGIGKTRAVQEFASAARVSGMTVLWGRCHERRGVPPFWPWTQAIRGYLQGCDPGRLRSELGVGASLIAEVVPEVREKLPDLERPQSENQLDESQLRLFDSFATLFQRISRTHALAVVLEDLHWADGSSLSLLEYAASELEADRVLLLGTYNDVGLRPASALAETLGVLAGGSAHRRLQRIRLPGLTKADTAQLVERMTGVTPPDDLAGRLHERTQGNPLLLTEVVRMMAQKTEGDPDQWEVEIPESVRDMARRRLNRLSEGGLQMLKTASVVGQEFGLDQVRTIAPDLTEDQALDLLDEALGANVIVELPESVGNYRFSQALVRDILVEEVSLTRRARIHGGLAESLEAAYAEDADSHAMELAHHYVQAQPHVGASKGIRYAYLAAEQARASFAYDEARTFYRMALDIGEAPRVAHDESRQSQVTDAQTANILLRLGSLSGFPGQRQHLSETMDALTRAFHYYFEMNDSQQVSRIARLLPTEPHLAGASELIERALELVSPESSEGGDLLISQGRARSLQDGDYEGGRAAFDKARQIAVKEADAVRLRSALLHAAEVDWHYLDLRGVIEKCRVVESTNGAYVHPANRVRVSTMMARARLALGAAEEAREHLASATPAVKRLRQERNERPLEIHSRVSARLAQMEGSWQRAREILDGLETLYPGDVPVIGERAVLESQVGESERAETYFQHLLDLDRRVPPGPNEESAILSLVTSVASCISGRHDNFAEAEAAADGVIASDRATPLYAFWARAGLALMAVERQDHAAASRYYDDLQAYRGTFLAPGICTDRLLGLLAYTTGGLGRAVEHFEQALDSCRTAGFRPEVAWCAYDYAGALLGIGSKPRLARKASIEEGRALLEEALEIVAALKMSPLKQRVDKLIAELEDLGATGPYPDGLTEREVEVLRLVAAGASNPQIAAQLFISYNTVANHVTSILTKTDTSNRTEAASYAVRKGLLQD